MTERASEHERRNPRHIYTRYRLSLGDVWCRRHFVSDTKATGALDARRKFPLSKENARSLLAPRNPLYFNYFVAACALRAN